MPRGRRPGSHQQIKCSICLHPERGRIDFLVCSGAGVQPTAKKFGVSYDSLRNHVAKHISQTYRDAVRSGPLQSGCCQCGSFSRFQIFFAVQTLHT